MPAFAHRRSYHTYVKIAAYVGYDHAVFIESVQLSVQLSEHQVIVKTTKAMLRVADTIKRLDRYRTTAPFLSAQERS